MDSANVRGGAVSDLVDYMFFFLSSIFIAVLIFAGHVQWSYWVAAAPTILALSMHMWLVLTQR